ncbi:unnamed protein product [Closterium sp. NIES-64]|nr:unnamed protein product [Closterium sp. NIES-64]
MAGLSSENMVLTQLEQVQLLPHLHSPPLAQPQPPAAAVLHPQGAFSAVHVQPTPQLQVAPAAGAADLHPQGEFSAVHVQPSPQLQVAPASGAAADLHPQGEFSAVHVQPSPQLQVAAAAVLQPQGEFSTVQGSQRSESADIDMETIASADAGSPEVPAVEVTSMQFAYPGEPPLISKFNLTLPRGSRCLLIGANGAGKTTLLRVLAGKHMVGGKDVVKVLGRSAFHDTALSCDGSLAYLGGSWSKSVGCAGEVPLQGDFSAEHMIYGVADVDAARRDHLVELLDIDLTWRMHRVSDGQRRRVQICMGLLRPFQVLLLDEVTVDLDVVARMDLLSFFQEECEERGATVVYATHIFDGLESWASHLAFVSSGKLQRLESVDQSTQQSADSHKPSALQLPSLLEMVEPWLREDKAKREKEVEEAKKRGDVPKRVDPFAGAGRHMAYYR